MVAFRRLVPTAHRFCDEIFALRRVNPSTQYIYIKSVYLSQSHYKHLPSNLFRKTYRQFFAKPSMEPKLPCSTMFFGSTKNLRVDISGWWEPSTPGSCSRSCSFESGAGTGAGSTSAGSDTWTSQWSQWVTKTCWPMMIMNTQTVSR